MGAVGVKTFQRAELTQFLRVEMAHKELVILVLLGLAARGLSTSPQKCFGCPTDIFGNIDCGAGPFGCTYGIVPDFCGCCDECARGPGEYCGGEFGICGNLGSDELYYDNNGECKWEWERNAVRWSPSTKSCIRGNNNLVLNNIFTLDECKSRCEGQSGFGGFTCRSVEYHRFANRCSLSAATSNSRSFRRRCPSRGWVYSQILDDSFPPPPPPAPAAPAFEPGPPADVAFAPGADSADTP